MLKAMIFDMGGTLEDVFHKSEFNEPCGKKFLDYFSRHGIHIDLSPEELMERVEAQNKDYRRQGVIEGRELGPYELWSKWLLKDIDLNQERLKAIADNLANIWERTYYSRSLRPDARPMLEEIKKLGIKMGVISNTSCYTQVGEILHEYGIHHFFECVYLSVISGMRKPNPELFLAAAADLGFAPAECVYVGDTVSRDVRGSRLAGYLGCIRINSELTGGSDAGFSVEGEEADYLVKSLMEIPGIARGINNPA